MEMENINPVHQWGEPQRQSPAAIFILLWSTAINLLKGFWPVLAVYFFKDEKDDDSLTLLWGFAGFSVLTIWGAVLGYWFKKFHIKDDTLIIQSGWLRKKTLSIPVHSIQAVHLEQNLWQQAFGVAKVSFDSIGSDSIEAKLDALTMGKAEELRHLLMEKKAIASPEADKVKQESISSTYSLAFPDLMKLSLTANHLEAFFILLALLINVMDELRQIFGGDDYMDTYGRDLMGQTVLFTSILVIAVIVLSMLFSIARTMVKYYGFRLMDAEQRWIISYGLFDKTKKIVPINKIQILSWKANWLRRKIDYWTVQVQSVGHKENKKTNIHIPVISFEQVIQLVNSYQYYSKIDDERSLKIEPAYWKRSVWRSAVIITLIPMMVFYFWIGWQAMILLLIHPFLVWNEYLWCRNFRWQTNEAGIQLVSGVFGRKFTLLNWKKVQQVRLHQNLYQRNRQLATVIFVTAGGKVTLPYIPVAMATSLVDQVLYEVESKEENWI
jgi:putative membrane protein